MPDAPREPSVVLQTRLRGLVLERQELRRAQATRLLLEQNRLLIVQTQLELSRALVSEHGQTRVA
jgi:hypothetical protein